jgi:hypothetical protein
MVLRTGRSAVEGELRLLAPFGRCEVKAQFALLASFGAPR